MSTVASKILLTRWPFEGFCLRGHANHWQYLEIHPEQLGWHRLQWRMFGCYHSTGSCENCHCRSDLPYSHATLGSFFQFILVDMADNSNKFSTGCSSWSAEGYYITAPLTVYSMVEGMQEPTVLHSCGFVSWLQVWTKSSGSSATSSNQQE